MRARLALVLVVLGGCFKPSPTEGFACGPDRWCPDPLSCAADNTCRSKDVDDPGDGGPGNEDLPGGPANVAFVTSLKFPPTSLGGIAGADAKCAMIGDSIGKPGRYVAWLSTVAAPVSLRLGGASGWVRVDGKPFAASRADLLAGHILYPLRKDENGADVLDIVMTGTIGAGTATENCIELTSNAATEFMLLGATDGGINLFTNVSEGPCNDAYRMYCLQAETATTVTVAPSSNPRAFLSTSFTPGAGIAAADAQCQSEATQNGLTGSYVAFLSTTTAAATARLQLGTPWVRVDNVETTADFFTYDGGFSVTAAGVHVDAFPYSGSQAPEAKSAALNESCGDWTGGGGSRIGHSARAIRGDSFGDGTGGCGSSPIYCLEKR
jgi:hypothetical protein